MSLVVWRRHQQVVAVDSFDMAHFLLVAAAEAVDRLVVRWRRAQVLAVVVRLVAMAGILEARAGTLEAQVGRLTEVVVAMVGRLLVAVVVLVGMLVAPLA